MMAGLPWQSWLLLIAAAGLGLSLVVPFYLTHRKRRTAPKSRENTV